MPGKIYRLGILAALTIILSLGTVLVFSSYPGVGVATEVSTHGLPLTGDDQPAIPPSVSNDATEMAETLFSKSQEKADKFSNQVLATYSEAKDKDFVILFNPGGWGWTSIENSASWGPIFWGIKAELDSMGYEALTLDYQRTEGSWRGLLEEATEMANFYPRKAEELASRVAFLTEHIPDLKVILTGESNGSVIAARVMSLLNGNPQVYSIQTGPPFWHDNITLERSLVLTSNGIAPDSFSQGNLIAMINANIRALLGFPQQWYERGTIGRYLRAPGHDYRWQYPKVYSEITGFLKQNFGIDWLTNP